MKTSNISYSLINLGDSKINLLLHSRLAASLNRDSFDHVGLLEILTVRLHLGDGLHHLARVYRKI